MNLTKKQRWVLEQMARGRHLCRCRFGLLFEVIEPHPTRAMWVVIAKVNRSVVDSLTEKGLIRVGFPPEGGTTRHLITDEGRTVIASTSN